MFLLMEDWMLIFRVGLGRDGGMDGGGIDARWKGRKMREDRRRDGGISVAQPDFFLQKLKLSITQK